VLALGAVAALVVDWLGPAPWLLALLLIAILSVLWAFAVLRFLSTNAWGDQLAAVDSRTLQAGGLVPSKAAENR
jgi:membrane protein implicated in regulation of membrane protease activity